MRWLECEFDNRCADDDCPELMQNIACLSLLPALVRDLVESSDWYIELDDMLDPEIVAMYKDDDGMYTMHPSLVEREAKMHRVPVKVVRRRNPEFQQHLLAEDSDEWAPETEDYDAEYGLQPVCPSQDDMLNHTTRDFDTECIRQHSASAMEVFTSEDVCTDETASDDTVQGHAELSLSAPKDTFDLIVNERSKDADEWYSADWFTYRQNKTVRGYARNLTKAVERGISARGLFKAIQEARSRNVLPMRKAKRLWELFDMREHALNASKYYEMIKRRKDRKRNMPARSNTQRRSKQTNQRVIHSVFGKGNVVSVQATTKGAKLTIAFEDTTRTILSKYVKLCK